MKGEHQMKVIKALFLVLIIALAMFVAKASGVMCEKSIKNNYVATTLEKKPLETVEYTPSKELFKTVKYTLTKEPIKKVEYTSLGVPNINSSFKTWMSYKAVTDKTSPQYKLINTYGRVDNEGFMRYSSEKELGIDQDYYMIALGSYYGTTIGTKYRITLVTGEVFYGVLADCKADRDTNKTNQYAGNNDVVEFIVDTKKLNSKVRYHGNANVYAPLRGSVAKIERIDFIEG